MTSDQDLSFLEELMRKASPAYEIFQNGEAAGAGRLVDLIVAEKLKVPEGFAQRAGFGEEALQAWGNSAESAKPYRNSMQLILDHFPAWWTAASEPGRATLAKHLPVLAPAVADLGDAGVRDLVEAGEPAFACAASYALADKPAVQAIAKVARAAHGLPERCSAVLAALAKAFPISLIEESREAERFLPALGKVVDAAGTGWAEAVELATALVSNDPSSAYGVLEAVPKALGSVRGDKQAYLVHFTSLVKALGNRVAGVCLKRLPGTSAPDAMVERSLALAARYGVNAAERYLETSL